jgi:hypothetical protein
VNAGVFIELSINRIFVDEPETYPDPCFVRILLCGQHPQKITSIRLPLSVTICTEMTLKIIAFSKLTSWDQTKRWSILSRVKLASQQSHQNLNSDLFIQKFLGIDVMSFLYNKRTLFQVLICGLTKYVGCFYDYDWTIQIKFWNRISTCVLSPVCPHIYMQRMLHKKSQYFLLCKVLYFYPAN